MNKIFSFLSDIFLDIFFPKRCVNCGKYGDLLCFGCVGEIEAIKTDTCPECGRISKHGRFCTNCKRKLGMELTGLLVAAHYRGPIKKMIHQYKYAGIRDLSVLLGEILFQRLHDHTLPGLIVVPVPLHRKREAGRGFNQSELMARYISKKLNLAGGMALARVKNTEPQARLAKAKRLTNLTGAFAVVDKDLVSGRDVLLVDDVATTLATLNECAKVLRQSGARRVWGSVVARG
ncbi:MAG: ComF family protein [Patescibacteria group bacterium]|jgi:ComF family protein